MKVVDMLKHKRDSFSKQVEFMDRMSPSLRHYWNDIVGRAHTQHLFRSWGKDFSGAAINEEVVEEVEKPAIKMNPETQSVYDELLPKIGEEIHIGDWFLIDQARIDAFAKVTEDMQWIHTDPVKATEQSPFKSTIAHGFLTLALLPRLTDSVDSTNPLFPTAKAVVNVGMNSVRFPYPVRVGSNVRARSKLLSVTPINKGLEIVRELKVEIEGVRRAACISESVMRLQF
jgi:acyl dehydratase